MSPTLVLVHSPLVGDLTWSPVAELLRDNGFRVVVPSLTTAVTGEGPYHPSCAAAVADRVRHDGADGPFALVVHSGAGALVPAVAQRTGASWAVFVDALLPSPGLSWFDTASEAQAERLRSLGVDGLLPPWHRWFPDGAVERLLPARARERFVRTVPRLPLAYFAERSPRAPVPPGAYVRLSAAYEPQADDSEHRGWPVRRVDAGHLAMLSRPESVAGMIEAVVSELR